MPLMLGDTVCKINDVGVSRKGKRQNAVQFSRQETIQLWLL